MQNKTNQMYFYHKLELLSTRQSANEFRSAGNLFLSWIATRVLAISDRNISINSQKISQTYHGIWLNFTENIL